MAKDEPNPKHATVLTFHPEYLTEIGTLVVELSNLELDLAELLASILKIPSQVAAAIYFAPQGFAPRLAILGNASEAALRSHKTYKSEA